MGRSGVGNQVETSSRVLWRAWSFRQWRIKQIIYLASLEHGQFIVRYTVVFDCCRLWALCIELHWFFVEGHFWLGGYSLVFWWRKIEESIESAASHKFCTSIDTFSLRLNLWREVVNCERDSRMDLVHNLQKLHQFDLLGLTKKRCDYVRNIDIWITEMCFDSLNSIVN